MSSRGVDFHDPEGLKRQMTQFWEALEPLRSNEGNMPLGLIGNHWLPLTIVLNWSDLQKFQFHEDDVVLSSFPKSGTNWLHYILHLLLTRCHPDTVKGHHPALLELPIPPGKPGFDKLAAEPHPRLFCTHIPALMLPAGISKARFIYIYRDPRDVCVSLYHHYKSMAPTKGWQYDKPFREFVRLFMSGAVFYGPHWLHEAEVLRAKKQGFIKRCLFVSYEDLKSETEKMIYKVADFLGIDQQITSSLMAEILHLSSVEQMRQNDAVNWSSMKEIGMWIEENDMIRKGIVGDWKEHFLNIAGDPNLLSDFEIFIRQNYEHEFIEKINWN